MSLTRTLTRRVHRAQGWGWTPTWVRDHQRRAKGWKLIEWTDRDGIRHAGWEKPKAAQEAR